MNKIFFVAFFCLIAFNQSNAFVGDTFENFEFLLIAQLSGKQMVPPTNNDVRLEFLMIPGVENEAPTGVMINIGTFSVGNLEDFSIGFFGPANYGETSDNALGFEVATGTGGEKGFIYLSFHDPETFPILFSGQAYVVYQTSQGPIRGQLEPFQFSRTPEDGMMNKVVEYNTIYTLGFQPGLHFGESSEVFDIEIDSDGMLLMHHQFLEPYSEKKLGPIENGDSVYIVSVGSLKCASHLFDDTFIFTYDFEECTAFNFLPIGNEGFFKLRKSGTNRCFKTDGLKLVLTKCQQASPLYATNCVEGCNLDPDIDYILGGKKRSDVSEIQNKFMEALSKFNARK